MTLHTAKAGAYRAMRKELLRRWAEETEHKHNTTKEWVRAFNRFKPLENERWKIVAREVLSNQQAASEPDFQGFADSVLDMILEGCDADGAEIQESAIRHGVLKAVIALKPCGSNCACVDCFDAEDFKDGAVECYRRAY